MKIKAFLALLLLFCILLPGLAQTKPAVPQDPNTIDDQDDVVKITTNLVQVDAVVTKDGKMVPNLTADDFEIYEDGRRQPITSFAYISNTANASSPPGGHRTKPSDIAPPRPLKRDDPHRTIALVVDDFGLSAESMHQVRRQLRKFIAEELQPNDVVAIMRTSGELGALQQFTNDRRLLNRAVDQLRWNICSRVGVSVLPRLLAPRGFGSHSDWNNCGGSSYYQTMKSLRFILDGMGELPGRKSMILLSDSVPIENQEVKFDGESSGALLPGPLNYAGLLQRIAEKAIRSSVVIYSVDTQGLQYTGITAADEFGANMRNVPHAINQVIAARSSLMHNRRHGGEMIARQTGGYQIRNSNSFKLDQILEDQSGYYLIGYRPTAETFNKRFHHIKAKVKRTGMSVRTRFGFFGVSEEEAQIRPPVHHKTNLALTSPFFAQDIDVEITSFFANDKTAGSVVRSFVYIDGKDLNFTPVESRQQASIELHGAIFGDNGAVIEQLTRTATVSLSESDYEQATRYGMQLTFDIPVKKPGSYQVRVAARDRTSSLIGSTGKFVAVPNLSNRRLAVSGIVLGTAPEPGPGGSGIANPGARRFTPNSDLHFAYLIYNATESGKMRNLSMDAKLFRDGKNIYSGPTVPISAANQMDPNRLLASGVVRLAPELEPGSYYLQVVITETGAKKEVAPVVQWVDFEVEK